MVSEEWSEVFENYFNKLLTDAWYLNQLFNLSPNNISSKAAKVDGKFQHCFAQLF